MDVHRHQDPRGFLALVEEQLRRDEQRHHLMLRLTLNLIDDPERYPVFHLWTVEDQDGVVGAALRTEPHNVVLAAPFADGAVETLVDALVEEGAAVPGVVGGLPEADVFASRFQAATGATVSSRTDQAIHVIHAVSDVPVPGGAPRIAGSGDLDLLVAWMGAFHDEAVPTEHYDENQLRGRLTQTLAIAGDRQYYIWDDGEPVCFLGVMDVASGTPGVGPVYTPPLHRRKGYGTALTAHASRERLERGARYCLLYTDLANPTSNAIYAKIGYRRVCDSAMILFA